MKVKASIEVDVTPELLGEWFAGLDDDAQCRFFVAAANTAQQWHGDWSYQFWAVGSHLRNCECSTDEARELVRSLHAGLERGTHN